MLFSLATLQLQGSIGYRRNVSHYDHLHHHPYGNDFHENQYCYHRLCFVFRLQKRCFSSDEKICCTIVIEYQILSRQIYREQQNRMENCVFGYQLSTIPKIFFFLSLSRSFMPNASVELAKYCGISSSSICD